MLVKFTRSVGGKEAGTVEREMSGSAAQMEDLLRETQQRTGRIVLEQAAVQVRSPRCCGRAMKNCGRRMITVTTTYGPVPVARTRYRCKVCGHECSPADARICCGRHRVTQPLAKRACQLAVKEYFPELPQ